MEKIKSPVSQAVGQRPVKTAIPKKADYTTLLCFIRNKKLEYTLKDMHIIGKKLADLYRQMYHKEPTTVQQVEGRQVIVVNIYPYEFSKYIHKAVAEHFKRRV